MRGRNYGNGIGHSTTHLTFSFHHELLRRSGPPDRWYPDRSGDKTSCLVAILELRLIQLTMYGLAGPLAIAALAVILSVALRH